MRTHLLEQPGQKRGTFDIFYFFLTLLFTFLTLFHNFGSEATSEEGLVGVLNLEWDSLLSTYFALGSFASTMRHGLDFRGVDDPKIDPNRCACAPKCEQICSARLKLDVPFAYDLPNGCPPLQSSDVEPAACHHRSIKTTLLQCWNPSLMRCWDIYGGIQVSDQSNHEWTLLQHHPRSAPNHPSKHPFTHMRSLDKQVDLIIFGWGSSRLVQDICEHFADESWHQLLKEIPPTQAVVFGGHSEGSGWAVCANLLMGEMSLPQQRRLIASGALMASSEFIQRYRAVSSLSDNLFLMHAKKMPAGFLHGSIVADTLPMRQFPEGSSFPQFSFTCTTLYSEGEESQCVKPQPSVDLVQEFSREASEQHFIQQTILLDIHSYDKYRECFKKCHPYFQTTSEMYAPNVPSFTKTTAASAGTSNAVRIDAPSMLTDAESVKALEPQNSELSIVAGAAGSSNVGASSAAADLDEPKQKRARPS